MAKYNITDKKEREAAYRSLISPTLMDELKEKILNVIVMQKKYKDKDYSAKKLALDLGTNTRYISAVVNVKFHMNYTSFVNKYRIEEAKCLMTEQPDLKIADVAAQCGFSSQSVFAQTFSRETGISPREWSKNY